MINLKANITMQDFWLQDLNLPIAFSIVADCD